MHIPDDFNANKLLTIIMPKLHIRGMLLSWKLHLNRPCTWGVTLLGIPLVDSIITVALSLGSNIIYHFPLTWGVTLLGIPLTDSSITVALSLGSNIIYHFPLTYAAYFQMTRCFFGYSYDLHLFHSFLNATHNLYSVHSSETCTSYLSRNNLCTLTSLCIIAETKCCCDT